MKIGYDAKRAFENQTGLGNYSRDLINTYSLSNPKFHFSKISIIDNID